MKKGDWIIIVICVLLSAASLLLLPRGEAARVEIIKDGKVLYSGALTKDARIIAPDGRNVVRIEGGRAYMAEADCKDGLCLQMGEAKMQKPVVCLPNRVVVRLVGESEMDAIAY